MWGLGKDEVARQGGAMSCRAVDGTEQSWTPSWAQKYAAVGLDAVKWHD